MKSVEIIHKMSDYLYFATSKLSKWLYNQLRLICQTKNDVQDEIWDYYIIQKINNLDKFESDYKEYSDLDLYWLLQITMLNKNEISKNGVSYRKVFGTDNNDNDLVKEMLAVRNRWAHLASLPRFPNMETIQGDLDIIKNFYTFFSSADREIADIDQFKNELEKSEIVVVPELVEKKELVIRQRDGKTDKCENLISVSSNKTDEPLAFDDVLKNFLAYEDDLRNGIKNSNDTFGGDKKYKFSDIEMEQKASGAWILGVGNCKDSIIVIRPKSNSKGEVSRIVRKAFCDCEQITGIIIPDTDGQIQIEESAFEGCTSLKDIYISRSVTSIGMNAFANCNSLSRVYAGDIAKWSTINFDYCIDDTGRFNVNSNPLSFTKKLYDRNLKLVTDVKISTDKPVSDVAFYNCDSIRSVTLLDKIPSVGNRAFENCTSLEKITFNYAGISIGNAAFRGCEALISVINAERDGHDDGNVQSCIGEYAFSGCKELKSIDISERVFEIGEGAFRNCELLQHFDIPQCLNCIHDWTFKNSGLVEIHIPDSVKSVGVGSFSKCRNLKAVTISNSVQEIGERAFKDCSLLESVKLPNKIENISALSFKSCSSLVEIVIPSSVNKIEGDAFYKCSSLSDIRIPKGVTTIGDSAFAWCSSLKKLSIPESVIHIDESAFSECKSLEKIWYNAAEINSVPRGIFDFSGKGGDGITLYIGKNVSKIPDFFFSSYVGAGNDNILNLKEIIFKENGCCKYIGECAFDNCSILANINMPECLKSIGKYAFRGTALTNIRIPNGVNSIGEGAFSHSSLQNVSIPKSLVHLNIKTFSSCQDLIKVIFSEESRCTNIHDMAFSNCSSLRSITIPEKVKLIGDMAFSNCTSLENVYYNALSAKVIHSGGTGVFYNAGKNQKLRVIIGAKVRNIPSYLFSTSSVSNTFDDHERKEEFCYVREMFFEKGSKCQNIYKYAINDCFSLNSISIPRNVIIDKNNFSGSSIESCYYQGTEAEWYGMELDLYFNDKTTVYYYNESKPVEEGNFWHYDEKGNPQIW